MRALGLALFLAHCAPPSAVAVRPRGPATASSSAATAAKPSNEARWVVRIATPAEPFRGGSGHGLSGPASNNFGTDQSVYLGGGRAGGIAGGRRFVFEVDRISYAAPSSAVSAVQRLVEGGFVFLGAGGLYTSSTFDGPLVQVAPKGTELLAILPHALHLSTGALVSTTTGAPIPNLPRAYGSALTHPLGFAVVTSEDQPSKAWCTTKEGRWTALRVPGRDLGRHAEETLTLGALSDVVVVTRQEKSFQVGAGCTLRALVLDEDEGLESRLRPHFMLPPGPSPEDEFYEGALAATHISLGKHRWLGVQDRRQLVLVDAAMRTRQPLGAPLGAEHELCSPLDATLAMCVTLGRGVHTYAIDLAKRTVTAGAAIEATSGLAHTVGASGVWPAALMIDISCEGRSDGHACVRRSNGTWSTVLLPTAGAFLPFEDDTMSMRENEQRDLVFESERRPARLVASAEVARLFAAMRTPRPAANARELAFVQMGALYTRDALRLFFVPSPFAPIAASPSRSCGRDVQRVGLRAGAMVPDRLGRRLRSRCALRQLFPL